MKAYKKLPQIIVLALSLVLSSCTDWLDVEPKSQVRDSSLFSSESGFKEALAGVYTTLAYEPLYGREMTFGLVGVLGAEWDFQSISYDFDKTYDYKNSSTSLNRIDAIWNQMYNAIANDNKLLEEIDAKKGAFRDNNFDIIKGEALALRAWIHFDLLRVFGASYKENPNKLSIPYFTKASKEIAPQLSVDAVINNVITDLNKAAELLKNDPIVTGQQITIADDNGYLMNRQVHLNYYAVKGLLARAYLYKHDHAQAVSNAMEVINAAKFPWITQNSLVDANNSNLIFSTEHLFALNIVRMSTIYQNSFTTTGGTNVFYMFPPTRTEYYDSNSDDYRYLYWYRANNEGNYFLRKYEQLESTSWPTAYRNKMPIIKLSEMYFIAAEALKDTDITKASALINEVRIHRGLTTMNIDRAVFDAVLLQEFRKDVIGEGQLFFFHKRLNSSRIPRSPINDIIAVKGYKLPIPVSELNNAPGRVDNQ